MIFKFFFTKNEKCSNYEYDEGSLYDDPDEDATGVVERLREVEQP
jgi:hypothetical protein